MLKMCLCFEGEVLDYYPHSSSYIKAVSQHESPKVRHLCVGILGVTEEVCFSLSIPL